MPYSVHTLRGSILGKAESFSLDSKSHLLTLIDAMASMSIVTTRPDLAYVAKQSYVQIKVDINLMKTRVTDSKSLVIAPCPIRFATSSTISIPRYVAVYSADLGCLRFTKRMVARSRDAVGKNSST